MIARLARALVRYSPLLILALGWELVAQLELVSNDALPPLSAIAAAWLDLMHDGDFMTNGFAVIYHSDLVTNGGASLYRGAVGLGLAIAIGGTLGILMARWKAVNVVFGPLVEMFYPVPKSALIPVTVIWLGLGDGSKILLIALGCMIPVTIGAFNGARAAEQTLIWSARSMGADRVRTLWDVVVPSALPELLNGIRTALALAFILLVSSEFIAAQDGVGYLISSLGDDGNYSAMYAVVLTVALCGFAADRVYQAFMQRMLIWRQ